MSSSGSFMAMETERHLEENITKLLSFFLPSFLSFFLSFNLVVWSLNSELARKVLYHLSHTLPSPQTFFLLS
jgi:hypothetical protein